MRMSCSCLSTACTSSCNSQRNSSSCGDRPLSAAQARRPLHAPAARPRARAPHQHCPLHRCRCHRSRHSRRSPPSDRLPLAVRRPLGRSATLGATSASDWLSSSQPRPRTTSPASDWLSDARPAPGSKRCEIERSWRVSEPPALSLPGPRRHQPPAPRLRVFSFWRDAALVPPLRGSDRVLCPTCIHRLACGMACSRRARRLADGEACSRSASLLARWFRWSRRKPPADSMRPPPR